VSVLWVRSGRVVAGVAGLVVVVVFGACSSGPEAAAYIPGSIGSEQVDKSSPAVRSMENSFRVGGLRELSAGSVGAQDPRPDVIFLAARGDPVGVAELERKVFRTFVGDAKVTERTVAGVRARFAPLQQGSVAEGGVEGVVVYAEPNDRTGLVVLAFDGGPKAAERALRAMLAASQAA
jgi:hypothetical protein